MDLNFHYYVTYSAAHKAGFSDADALLIACAARYVDECEDVTVQSFGRIIRDNMKDSFEDEKLRRAVQAVIWPVFHFLPGDYEAIEDYLTTQYGSGQKLSEYHLICGPESRLTDKLVQAARECYQGSGDDQEKRKNALVRIGIAMHTLADTFAHQNFAGIASYGVNEVHHVMHLPSKTGRAPEELFTPQSELKKQFTRINYCVPGRYSPAPSKSSFGNLGHGRIGTYPDIPGEVLLYRAQWRDPRAPWILRYNPLEFYCAYLQMTGAMRYILDNDPSSSFQNRMDRFTLLDREWAETRKAVNVFLQATDDQKLVPAWREYTAGQDLWTDRTYRSLGESEELKERFIKAAGEQIELVLTNCPDLADYIECDIGVDFKLPC